LLLLASCFSDPPKVEPTDDPITTCRECEQAMCTSYYQACMADPECNACIDAPINLGCLGPMALAFRGLAYCSCDQCANECGYMCPGGPRECSECRFAAPCEAQQTECTNDSSCLMCLQDPFDDGCQESMTAQALDACVCEACGPRCLWQCDAAVGECTGCLLGEQCAMVFGACMGDDECSACFANNALAGCDENAMLDAVAQCVCESCPECGPLFPC
jgi:hypothetical protein